MKNETVVDRKLEGKAGVAIRALPWWAQVRMAPHAEVSFARTHSHHIHHCSDCDCVLISTDVAYHYASRLCPECSTKKRLPQGGN
jgi:hypothetical protein